MPASALVRATALLDFSAVMTEAGADPVAALRAAQIDPRILSRPDMMIPADRVAWLLDGVAERSGIPDLAIRMAFRRRMANLGVAGLVLVQQPTVRDALAISERYRHLLSDALSLHVEDEDGVTTLRVSLAIGASSPGRQTRELGLAACVHVFRLLLGESWAPDAAHFTHPAPEGATLHRRFFRCPVRFDSEFDGVECPSADLDRVNADGDANLASYAASLLDLLPAQNPRPTTGMVARLIQALLPMGRASIKSVGKSLNRNVRTLQRELESEGSEFTAILSEVRARLASDYLGHPSMTIDIIAERLGYASSSSFIRFFRGQFGVSPGEWRKQGRAQPAAVTASMDHAV